MLVSRKLMDVRKTKIDRWFSDARIIKHANFFLWTNEIIEIVSDTTALFQADIGELKSHLSDNIRLLQETLIQQIS